VLFAFVKQLGKSPDALGNELGAAMMADMPGILTQFNIVKGFLNFTISNDYWFDFINAIPRFKQVKIKSSLLDVVIESSKEKIIEDFKLKIPNQIDECILRYIEYVEYFAIHPDKIKHVDYINSFFESKPEDKKFFFDRLNHFTCLPIDEISKINKLNKVIKNIKYIKKLILASYYVYKQEGFLSLFEKVSRRLNLKSKKN
jgi:hypothetical protein